MWHDPTNMTVAQSQKMISEYLHESMMLSYITKLEAELSNVSDMDSYIETFVREFAIKEGPMLPNVWKAIKILGEAVPEDEKINSVTIG